MQPAVGSVEAHVVPDDVLEAGTTRGGSLGPRAAARWEQGPGEEWPARRVSPGMAAGRGGSSAADWHHARATVKMPPKSNLGTTSLFVAGAFQFSIFLSLKIV